MKTCNKCDVELVIGENTTEGLLSNHNYACKACRSAYHTKYMKNPANKKAMKERSANWYQANRDLALAKTKARHKGPYKERKADLQRERMKDPKKLARAKKQQKAYLAKYPERYRYANAKRRALILKQTPSWYCEDTVKEIYAVAHEFGYEVDHIVPLAKGGLHSHENLQLLTMEENRSKSARDY